MDRYVKHEKICIHYERWFISDKSVAPSFKGQRGSDFHRKYCLPMMKKANKDDSVKAILTAGNSYDGYRQLYEMAIADEFFCG